MNRLTILIATLGLLVPSLTWAQPTSRSAPPSCSVAELAAGTCASPQLGARVRVRNNDALMDDNCASGTGANATICVYNGTNWVSEPLVLDGALATTEAASLPLAIPFCGQGGNAATRYIGPQTGIGVDVTPANATCDGYDSDTVGGADALPLGISIPYAVHGMTCQLNSGTDDTVEMTLYDDTVEVAAVTCTITAAGGVETCAVTANATIGAGSLLAIEADPDDDDLSAQDFYCLLFVNF